MAKNLLDSIFTKSDANVLENELEKILSYLFKEGSIDDKIKKTVRIGTYEFLKSDFPEFKDRKAIKNFLESTREKLRKLRIINMTIAFEPTASLIEKIGKWVKENIGEDVVFDLSVDKSIIGGAEISFNGKYKEYILRDKFNEVFKNRKEELLKCLE